MSVVVPSKKNIVLCAPTVQPGCAPAMISVTFELLPGSPSELADSTLRIALALLSPLTFMRCCIAQPYAFQGSPPLEAR